jgi:phosphate transport system substrate-binding protein
MKAIAHLAGVAVTLVLATLLASCGEQAPQGAASAGGHVVENKGTAIKGAGSTFITPLVAKWIDEYRRTHEAVAFTYDAVGSGEGVKRFLAGTVDFGASDAALNDKELAQANPRRGAVMIPMAAGMVVLAYNLPGITGGLSLARDVYLDIFAGRIRSWSDPRIAATNPGLQLPKIDIVRVVRRDSSGTTFIMTNHLGAADPWWATQGPGVGKLVDWGGAMTAVGNEGVAQRVKITSGAIGYMGYEVAHRLGLPVATLQNKAGTLVAPNPQGGQLALASVGDQVPANLRLFLPDPDGIGSYPIVGYTWVLLDAHYADPVKAQALKDTLGWGLAQGQSFATALGFVPLPPAMVAKARVALAGVR